MQVDLPQTLQKVASAVVFLQSSSDPFCFQRVVIRLYQFLRRAWEVSFTAISAASMDIIIIALYIFEVTIYLCVCVYIVSSQGTQQPVSVMRRLWAS